MCPGMVNCSTFVVRQRLWVRIVGWFGFLRFAWLAVGAGSFCIFLRFYRFGFVPVGKWLSMPWLSFFPLWLAFFDVAADLFSFTEFLFAVVADVHVFLVHCSPLILSANSLLTEAATSLCLCSASRFSVSFTSHLLSVLVAIPSSDAIPCLVAPRALMYRKLVS